MIHRDDLPDTPDWTCEPRACGMCDICMTPTEAAWMHKLGDNIVLSDN